MLLIRGGRVLDPKSGLDEKRDILIDGGRIKHIGDFEGSGKGLRVLNADGLTVAPGLIDIHAHFRDPGLTYKEDILSGAAAAARGGFTTVICMANTKPPVDNPETLKTVLDRAAQAPVRVLALAAVTKGMLGAELTDMRLLSRLGAVGFSDDGVCLTDASVVREAFLLARELNLPVSLHLEDPKLIGTAGINDGEASAFFGLAGAPCVSESSMVARDCMLALDTGAKAHMQHLSCGASVAAVRMAKALGAKVTAEATPQHFSLTEEAVIRLGSVAKVNPPLRSEHDRLAVIEGLKDGTIDIIATDHAPHSPEEKALPLTKAPSGMIGLETALALGITHLVREGHLKLIELLAKMTCAPAGLYGLDGGSLAEGARADIVIFDENEPWMVKDFASKSKNSPFIGQTLYGKVKYTVCGGEIVYCDSAK